MEILAHRGFWGVPREKNTPMALRKALESGFGFESDIRDFKGDLVISHDIANETCQKVEEIFQWLTAVGDQYCFAINIKADGLINLLIPLLEKYCIANYFTFDMSVPQMMEYMDSGLIYFTRQSEIEPNPVLYNGAAGVWIDGFLGVDWVTEELLQKHLDAGKAICLVSPELHGRQYVDSWIKWENMDLDWARILLCTDRPREAAVFFAKKLGGVTT